MNFEHISGSDEARKIIAEIGEHRSRQSMKAAQAPEDEQKRTDLVLHALHAALSAQRTLWRAFATLRESIRVEIGHELSDSALSYIGELAASRVVDHITHEHVAELLAIKEPPAQPEAGANE